MSIIKNTLIGFGILAAIFGYGWLKHSWGNRMIEKYKDEWTVVAKSEFQLSLTRPWTWFGSPIRSIFFIEKNGYGKLSNRIYVASTLKLIQDAPEDQENEYASIIAIDVDSKTHAVINSSEELLSLSAEKLRNFEWLKYNERSFAWHLEQFFIENVKSYYMFDFFGYSVDVTNYIMSGQYEILDGEEELVITLRNNLPYKIQETELILVENALKERFKDDKNFVRKTEIVRQQDIEYSFSKMQQAMADYFEIKIEGQLDQIDTTLIRYFFFTEQFDPTDKTSNKVIIYQDDDYQKPITKGQ